MITVVLCCFCCFILVFRSVGKKLHGVIVVPGGRSIGVLLVSPEDGLMRPKHVVVLTTQMVYIIYSRGPASSKEATVDTNRFVH